MIILTIRTDKPEAELGIYRDHEQLAYDVWQAHRELAETVHQHIDELLTKVGMNVEGIEAIVVYKGPGSFTGLRIGLSLANALAYGLQIPLVATQDDWIERGVKALLEGHTVQVALPEYGAPVHITQQKK